MPPLSQPMIHYMNHYKVLFAAIIHTGTSAPTISLQTWKHTILCSLLVPCQTVLWCWHSQLSFYLVLLMLAETPEIQSPSCFLLGVVLWVWYVQIPLKSSDTKAMKSLSAPWFVAHL